MFRRRPSALEVPITMLTESERELVGDWWQSAAERIDAGPRETTWLSATLMVQMTLGYAENSDSRVSPLAYAFATRSGYALRMFVDRLVSPRPLDVSGIEPDSIATLATFPVDAETGTADIPDDVSDRVVLPIVMLVSDTANQPDRFTEIVSVEPPIWNAVVEVATHRLQSELTASSVIRRPRDLSRDVVESFLRFGYVLRSADEAFGLI
jgi:hypothetical protein